MPTTTIVEYRWSRSLGSVISLMYPAWDDPDMAVAALLKDRKLVPKAFDRVAHRYDRLTSMNPGYDEHLRMSARRMAALPYGRLLDLCCGTGRSTAAVIETYPDATVVGLDASRGMLDRCRKGVLARLVQADAAAPALRAESCDAVFMAYGLRNMGDPDAALVAVKALLRPGGRLALHEYALTDTRSRVTWAIVAHLVIIPAGRIWSGSGGLYRYLYRSVARFDSADQLVERLRRHGFTDVERHDTTHWQKGITHTFTASRGAPPPVSPPTANTSTTGGSVD